MEMVHYTAAFHLGLHCLPKTHLRVDSIQRVKNVLEIPFYNCVNALHPSQQFFSHVTPFPEFEQF